MLRGVVIVSGEQITDYGGAALLFPCYQTPDCSSVNFPTCNACWATRDGLTTIFFFSSNAFVGIIRGRDTAYNAHGTIPPLAVQSQGSLRGSSTPISSGMRGVIRTAFVYTLCEGEDHVITHAC